MLSREPTLDAPEIERVAEPAAAPQAEHLAVPTAAAAPAVTIPFAKLVAEDLAANTQRSGFRGGVHAFLTEPAFSCVLLHRLACKARSAGFGILARILWRMNVWSSSCHIHLEAVVGRAVRLPHPTGIVVGKGARIGHSVTLYQNVTLGRSLKDERYPVIEDEVVIFPNSVVVGGITIGAREVIGAGSVVIADVPADSIVTGNPAKLLRL